MKTCVLKFFYGEITKYSVHDKKFVKPKQYVCFQLVFSVFRPRFRKLLRLALSEMFFRMSSRNFITSAMILWILALIIRCFLRWIFLKLRPVVVPYLK